MVSSFERALAKLSLAAMMLDLLFCVMIWKFVRESVPWVKTSPALGGLIAFVLVVVVYVFFVEVLFAGRSIGRFSLGLSVSPPGTAEALPLAIRLKRFFSICSGFGLKSLNPNRLPDHNCADGIAFRSDLAGRAPVRSKPESGRATLSAPRAPSTAGTRSGEGQGGFDIEVVSGPHRGMHMALKDGHSFQRSGMFTIGRAAVWADLVLDQDPKVSSMHCRLAVKDGRLYIADGAAVQRPSTNGTLIGGSSLSADNFVPLRAGATVTIGGSAFIVRAG